jgi:hypothetical protein
MNRFQELISPGWESIPRLLRRFTNTGSGNIFAFVVLGVSLSLFCYD